MKHFREHLFLAVLLALLILALLPEVLRWVGR